MIRTGQTNRSKESKAFKAVALVLLVISFVLAWQLREQNRLLASVHADHTRKSTTRASQPVLVPPVGTLLHDVGLLTLTGSATHLRQEIGEELAVIALFRPDCPSCVQGIAHWTELASRMRSSGHRLVAISLGDKTETRVFVDDHEPSWPVLAMQSASDARGLGVAAVPSTLLVSPDLIVRGSWMGPLSENALQEIIGVVEASVGVDVGAERE